jgi:hypothetical protein
LRGHAPVDSASAETPKKGSHEKEMTTVRAHGHMSHGLGSGELARKRVIGDRESERIVNFDIRSCETPKLEVPK